MPGGFTPHLIADSALSREPFTPSQLGLGDVVTYVAFLFHPVPSTIFSIALVMLEVATPR